MTIEQLLEEIRHIAERDPTDSPAVRRKLSTLVNRSGAAELLAATVRTGESLLAQTAALALPFARSELVRRALVQGAKRESGERRLNYLAALQPEELQRVLAETGGVAVDDLIEAAGLLAVNDPGEFVEVLCEGAPLVDLGMVEHVERVRRRFAIAAAALYRPLLERKMSAEARQRAFAILGREGGEEVRHLLETAQRRLSTNAEKTSLRREQLRQATLSAEGRGSPARDGAAVLHPLDGAEEIVLEIFERLGGGRLIHSTVKIGPGNVAHVTAPADGDLEIVATQATGIRGARITLGNARAFLEAIPQRRRGKIAPLLDRLGDTSSEPLHHPQPGPALTMAEARLVVVDPLWREWRPFFRLIEWTAPELLPSQGVSSGSFPGRFEDIEAPAERDTARVLKRKSPAVLNSELRYMALVMHLRGDPRAGALAAETIAVARRKPSNLLRALAERERWRQLWAHVPLPQDYRTQLRESLRRHLEGAPPEWKDVRLLDLAQAAMEGAARDLGELGFASGLPALDRLPVEAALRLAEHAASVLGDPELRKQHARAEREELLAQATRRWGETLPSASLFEVAQLAQGVCFGTCPHRCFEQAPQAAPRDVFQSDAPPGGR